MLLYLATQGWDGSFAEGSAALRKLVKDGFLSVRVDPYRRPDIASRYDAGGWPAVLLLLPDGRIFAAAVDVPPGNTRLYLRRLLAAYRERRELIERMAVAPRSVRSNGRSYAISADAVYRSCVAAFDSVHGGFGSGHKSPEPGTLDFLSAYAQHRPASEARRMVRQTWAALLSSPMVDPEYGGVHAFSFSPDWRIPAGEKDAADQALLVEALWADQRDAGPSRQETITQLLSYVRKQLWDPETGAFHGRQVRMDDGSWWTDPLVYADRHALLTRVCARAAGRLHDGDLAMVASRAADYLVSACMNTTGAVSHVCGEPQPAGLLTDQALAGLALQEVASLTGKPALRRAARAAAEYIVVHLAGQDPGFRDRPAGLELAGLHAAPIFPYMDTAVPAGNAAAAELFMCLGQRSRAEEILDGRPLWSPPSRQHGSTGRVWLEFWLRRR